MDLITLNSPLSVAAEAYRSLRTNLFFSGLEQPFKTLLLVAPSSIEHKGIALANLAVVLAQADRRVIAVDADFRSPELHTIFGLANDQGLSSALASDRAAINLQSTSVTNLSILTSGPAPAVPSDALYGKRMAAVSDALKQQAELILFNCPPTDQASDAGILATICDVAMIVVCNGRTRREAAQAARELMTRAHTRLLGAMLLND